MSRNNFLQFAGATAAATGLVLAGCDNDDDGVSTMGTVDLGSGDTGILNYAYLLEQLEAVFYVQVIATPFTGITAAEKTLLTHIRDHELAHCDFFKYALGASAIASVEANFASIDFTNCASVLGTAKSI